MDPILERAARWGIETRYRRIRAPANRRAGDAGPIARRVASDDAAAARMLPRTIVVRGERDRAVAVARRKDRAAVGDRRRADHRRRGGSAPSLTLPPRLPCGLFRLRVTAATAAGRVREEHRSSFVRIGPIRATHPRHGGCGRWPCSSTASARPQLGPWRFHRSAGAGRACGRSRRLRRWAQSPACLVRRSAVGAEPVLPEQPAVLNPLYIDLDAVPRFTGLRAAGLEAGVERLRDEGRVDYRAVADANGALRLAYGFRQSGGSERRDAFDRFRRARGRCWRGSRASSCCAASSMRHGGNGPAMAKGERRGARRSAANRGGRTWLLRVRAVVGA